MSHFSFSLSHTLTVFSRYLFRTTPLTEALYLCVSLTQTELQLFTKVAEWLVLLQLSIDRMALISFFLFFFSFFHQLMILCVLKSKGCHGHPIIYTWVFLEYMRTFSVVLVIVCIFLKYGWMEKYVKTNVMLFKHWKLLFKIPYQALQ